MPVSSNSDVWTPQRVKISAPDPLAVVREANAQYREENVTPVATQVSK